MKKIFIIFFFFFLLAGFFPVFAQQEKLTLVITPPLIKVNISPGDNWSSSIKIVNNNPKDLEIFASIMDFTSGKEGGVVFLQEKDIKGGESFLLSHWVEISSEPILIPAYQSKQVPFTIRVPLSAEPGGKYAAILAGTQPTGEEIEGAGVKITTLVSSLILANIRGEAVEGARIREFSTGKSFYQKPEVRFTLRMENIGNIHIQPQGEIRIFNLWGKERGIIPINHKTDYGNILPQSTRKWNFIWKGEESPLEFGRYKAILTLMYGNEAKQTVSRTIHFWILPAVPTLVIFGGIFLFFAFIILFIRSYTRRAVFLAQKEAGIIKSDPVKPSRKIKLSFETLKKPFFEMIDDFQKIRLKTKNKLKIIIFLTKRYFAPSLVLLMFVLAMTAVFFYFKDVLKESKSFEVKVEQAANVEFEESQTILEKEDFLEENEPIIEEINKEDLTITILNGSGVEGAAIKVAEKLKEKDFSIKNIANADSFDYQKTLIKYKIGKKKEAELLNQLFNREAELLEIEAQEEDLIIIIGKELDLGA